MQFLFKIAGGVEGFAGLIGERNVRVGLDDLSHGADARLLLLEQPEDDRFLQVAVLLSLEVGEGGLAKSEEGEGGSKMDGHGSADAEILKSGFTAQLLKIGNRIKRFGD